MQPLHLIVYQDIPLRMGGHGLVNQRDGEFGLLIPNHPDAALVEHVVEGRAQVAGFGYRFEQEIPAVREDRHVAGHRVKAGEEMPFRDLAVVLRRPLRHIAEIGLLQGDRVGVSRS